MGYAVQVRLCYAYILKNLIYVLSRIWIWLTVKCPSNQLVPQWFQTYSDKNLAVPFAFSPDPLQLLLSALVMVI